MEMACDCTGGQDSVEKLENLFRAERLLCIKECLGLELGLFTEETNKFHENELQVG